MEKIKTGKIIIITSMVFYFIYNTYFGWNKKPLTDIEQTFDEIYSFFMIIGWIIYFLPILDKYEKWIIKK